MSTHCKNVEAEKTERNKATIWKVFHFVQILGQVVASTQFKKLYC